MSISTERTVRAWHAWRYFALVVNAHRSPHISDEPLVSVIIATYNWSSVLHFAIASVLAQDYANIEVLVIGDGCTDDSQSVVEQFDDPRIRWHNLPVNSGSQSMPNNTGIALASGKYIAYLGHDDLWRPNHLRQLVRAIQLAQADIASSTCLAIGPPGSNLVRLTGGLPGGRSGTWCPPSSVLHRSDAVTVTGPWQDFREIEDPPDVSFVRQFEHHGLRHVRVRNCSVVKFNAAWRPNSYRLRASAEQQHFAGLMRHQRLFVERQLIALARMRLVRAPETYVQARKPVAGADTRGWLVSEWRRIRGLHDIAQPPTDGEVIPDR